MSIASSVDNSQGAISIANQMRSTQIMNEGIACLNKKQPERALELIEEAIALNPQSGLAYFNRGAIFYHLSNFAQMQLDFQTAFNLDSQNGEMMRNMSYLFVLAEMPQQAIKVAQRGLEILPNSEDMWINLLNGHYMIGNMDTALRLGEHVAAKFPSSTRTRIADALYVPQVAMSNEQIDAMRARLLHKLDNFLRDGLSFAEPVKHMRNSLFYLPYQGRPNKEMAQTIAKFFLKACPPLNYTAPHCEKPRKPAGEVLRVGFVSPSMHQPTLNQFFMGLMEALHETPGFETWIFSSAPRWIRKYRRLKNASNASLICHWILIPVRG
ncbi:MAG: hypothetical protein LW823_01315 [Rickettsiales bacterium]|jgi:tetratricopeptide (TPR) repeat protein|nr:hypothetical protein [Rickettsiales bacterium]